MAHLNSVFDSVVISRTPSWSNKGLSIKRYHYPDSAGQNLAQANFTEAAAAAYGSQGFVGGLPAVAAAVRASLAGKSALPSGQAAQNAARNREMRHRAAPGVAAALRARAQAKGASRGYSGGGGGGRELGLPF